MQFEHQKSEIIVINFMDHDSSKKIINSQIRVHCININEPYYYIVYPEQHHTRCRTSVHAWWEEIPIDDFVQKVSCLLRIL